MGADADTRFSAKSVTGHVAVNGHREQSYKVAQIASHDHPSLPGIGYGVIFAWWYLGVATVNNPVHTGHSNGQ